MNDSFLIHAACVQMGCLPGNPDENTRKMVAYIRRIKEERPDTDLIVFPECAVTGYECEECYERCAETLRDGTHVTTLCAAARENAVLLVFGYVEKSERANKTELFNSTVLVERDGTIAGQYRKSNLVPGMEKRRFAAGCTYPVFETSIGKIGLMICWDSVFPEVARILALQGVELIVVPEAVETGIEREWQLALCARAFDNGVFVLSCNHTGTERALTYFGQSMLVAPNGEILRQASDLESILYCEIDLRKVRIQQEYFPMLAGCCTKRYASVYAELAGKRGKN